MTDTQPSATILDYHRRTRHHLHRYAAGPVNLDWNAQPAPFRDWSDTRRVALPRTAERLAVPWSALSDERPAAPFDIDNLGGLLQLTSAITAWKQYGGSRWALRAHPSSGNLHPTETWVIAEGVEGLADGLYHYQPRDHTLEWRAGSQVVRRAAPRTTWPPRGAARAEGPSQGHCSPSASGRPGLWLGFSSIHWREAWKYGERALRYCQLDQGHVLAALAHAAGLHGWRPRLVRLDHAALARCLGLDRADDFEGVEPEEAEAIVALHVPPGEEAPAPPTDWHEWAGRPSLLDPDPHYRWPVIDEAAHATRGDLPGMAPPTTPETVASTSETSPSAISVILGRRSAQAFDGHSVMPTQVFRRLLASLLPGGSRVWSMWDATPRIHPVLFVHRVDGVTPGLYVLPRSEAGLVGLGEAMRRAFDWTPADPELPLYRLLTADPTAVEHTARTVSCHQDIAADCAVAFMFVAEFAAPIAANPAAWRHLHWEAGMLGHNLGLEAEAAGWRGTGIGCFFDDADHELLGLADERFQAVYHYAVGMALEDSRIATLPCPVD